MSTSNSAVSCAKTIRRRVAILLLIVSFLCVMTGCGDGLVRVYVDNGGKSAMTISVDGQEPVSLPAGEFTGLRLEPGQRNFQITSAGQSVFAGTKNLEKSEFYLFNPDFNNRYAVYEVRYGSERLSGAFARGAQMHLEEKAGKVVDETTREYVMLARQSDAMPMSPWFEIPSDVAYVLTDPPPMVITQTGTDRRVVLRRVSREDHAFIRSAADVETATQSDLDRLIEITDRLELGEMQYTSHVDNEEEAILDSTGADQEAFFGGELIGEVVEQGEADDDQEED